MPCCYMKFNYARNFLQMIFEAKRVRNLGIKIYDEMFRTCSFDYS